MKVLNKKGQSLVEYAILIGIIALTIIAALALFGDELLSLYQTIVDAIAGA